MGVLLAQRVIGSKDYEQYEAKQKLIALNDDGTLTLPEEKEAMSSRSTPNGTTPTATASLYSFLMEKSPS